MKCKESKFKRRLDDSLTDQRRLSLTHSAAYAVSRKEEEEVVLPLEGPLVNMGFVGGLAGREAWALRRLRSLSLSQASKGPQSSFHMTHIT